MPIVDVQLVAGEGCQSGSIAGSVANALAVIFKAAPGRVWVRFSHLSSSDYAENGPDEATASFPVFVRVLHADPSPPEALALEAKAIAVAVGACVGRSAQQVHVEYAPPGRGRVAFGGSMLT